jgi:hypothetical protein
MLWLKSQCPHRETCRQLIPFRPFPARPSGSWTVPQLPCLWTDFSSNYTGSESLCAEGSVLYKQRHRDVYPDSGWARRLSGPAGLYQQPARGNLQQLVQLLHSWNAFDHISKPRLWPSETRNHRDRSPRLQWSGLCLLTADMHQVNVRLIPADAVHVWALVKKSKRLLQNATPSFIPLPSQ